jgi:methylmalonyl-CoA/ethylmalonyl-CoA epimerase
VDHPTFEGLSQIGQINIPVRDVTRAIAFYRDALGIKFLFDVPNMAFFDCGGIRLLLGIPEGDEEDHPSSILYFKVDDIQMATESLKDRGVEFTSDPHLVAKMTDHDLWMSFFIDPDGNTLAVMAEIHHPEMES